MRYKLQDLCRKIKQIPFNVLVFFCKGERLYFCAAALIVLLTFLINWIINKRLEFLFDFSTFTTVITEGIVVAGIGLLRPKLLNLVEDRIKLTTDYDKLVKRYASEEKLIKSDNSDGRVTIPVICEEWLYNGKIELEDHPEEHYCLPDLISKHFEELFSAHETSSIYNNINIRVDDWRYSKSKDKFIIVTGRTTYYNSLVTNRVMDYRLVEGITVRELLECGPVVKPLKYSALSNHLGFNGFVESADGFIMLVYRKKNVSIGKRTYADSVGASLKTKYALNAESEFTLAGLEKGIVSEIEDELGICQRFLMEVPGDSSLRHIRLVSAYRDMLEGGKPQLLFYAKTSLSKNAIEHVFDEKNEKIRKLHDSSARSRNEKQMETDGNVLYWIPTGELKDWDVYADGMRMNRNGKDIFLKMVPSAAACVVMFKHYLEDKNKTDER